MVGTKPVVGAAVVSAVCKVKALLEKERVGATTVRSNWREAVPEALVAEIVTVKKPVCVGVPEISPVLGLHANPVGNGAAE
jgi:hypothetical protein